MPFSPNPRSSVVTVRWVRDSRFASSMPPEGVLDRSAASLPRVLWGEFPALRGTISRLRRLSRLRAALRCLRLALPCLWSCSLPVGRTTPTGLGCFLRGARAALHDKEQLSPPRFLGDPCVHAHALRPRRSGDTRPSSAATAAFRYSDNVGSARSLSRLNHTACTPPVYASQAGSLPHHATLGSGGWPTLTGSGLAPGGSHKKVSDSVFVRYRPPLPGFAWRNGDMIKAVAIERHYANPVDRTFPVAVIFLLPASLRING